MKYKYYNVVAYGNSITIHTAKTLQEAYYITFSIFKKIHDIDYCEIWEHNYDENTFEDNKFLKDKIKFGEYIHLIYEIFLP